MDWDALTRQKYALLQQEQNTRDLAAKAQANLQGEQAKYIGLDVTSQANLRNATRDYTAEQAKYYGQDIASQIGLRNASRDYTNQQALWYGPEAKSTIAERAASTAEKRAQTNYLDSVSPSLRFESMQRPVSILSGRGPESIDELFGMRYKRGTARVPGKGNGDKVPAMLEPGEAVLNKKAAGMIGRDKIAKMNAKGNAQRDKQESKGPKNVAELLKMMMGGMA